MKCEHCGSNLTLEDKVCPYCGMENKLAGKHISDMDKFEKDYTSVRDEVLSNSRRFNGFTARLTIIAILIALFAFLLAAIGHKYEIRNMREEDYILAHLDEHKAELDSLMASRDYSGVYYYYKAYRLPYSDDLNEYYMAYIASDKYSVLMDSIFYLYEDRDKSYNKPEEFFERIASIAQQLEEMRIPANDFTEKKYYSNDSTVAYINDLADHSELIIKGYFDLSDEDMEKFRTLSKARKQVMLEEGWTDED